MNINMPSNTPTIGDNPHLKPFLLHMPGYIYWKNTESQYMGCNPNLARISGLTEPAEIIGKTDFDFDWGADEAQSFIDDDKEVMRTGVVKVTEHKLPIKREDGKFLYVRTEKCPLYDEDNNVIGVMGVAVDITEQKLLEEQLVQEKTKSANAHKQKLNFIAHLSHEVLTPLFSIKIFVKGLANRLAGLEEAISAGVLSREKLEQHVLTTINQLAKNTALIFKEVDAANTLIDMLVTSVRDPHSYRDAHRLCYMTSCVNTALQRYPFANTEDRNRTLWDPKGDFKFHGSEMFIIHLIFNLVKNALCSISNLPDANIKISLYQVDGWNILSVKDSGNGIPEDKISRVFDAFYTASEKGHGIGLSFCCRVVESHNGEIECRSNYGEYCEFIVKLPKINN